MSTLKKIWLYSLIFKLIVATILPLSHDEAYYWMWSHHVQLSYFDHPAMVAWLFWVGHFLEPFGHAVRIPAVLLGHAALWFWILILKKYFDLERAKSWLWLALSSPLIGFGSLIITPDIPLVFFWSASVYLFITLLEKNRLQDYICLGASLGLGFCSKYHIVLFVPMVLTYLTIEKKWSFINWKKALALVATGFLFSLPVLIWNYQNDFASFKFQLAHGLERPDFRFSWVTDYLFGQILLLFPWVFWRALRPNFKGPARFVIYASWGTLIFFFMTSFKAAVEANWPIAAYPGIFMLAVVAQNHWVLAKRVCYFWLFIYIALIVSCFFPNLEFNTKLKEPFLFRKHAALVKEYSPLYASTYQMASSLWYLSKTPVYKLRRMNRFDFYDTLSESKPTVKKFYLLTDPTDNLPSWVAGEGWSVNLIKKIDENLILLEVSSR